MSDGPFEARSGGARLAAESRGSGPAVVLLHAGIADRRVWGAPSFPGWRTIAWDRRGFGETVAPAELHHPADDLFAVMDAAGVDRAVLVGNSMGGLVALEAALARPERVRGLLLLAPAVTGAPAFEYPPEYAEIVAAYEAADAAGEPEALIRIESRVWLDGALEPEGRITGAPRALLEDMNRQHLALPPIGPQRSTPPVWPRLGEIAVPVRVIVGALDLPDEVARSRQVAEAVKDGTFARWEGVAHLPSLEVPERLDAEIRGFLARFPD